MIEKIIICVDLQQDFFYGALANIDAQKIIPNIKEKLEKDSLNDKNLIIFTHDTHFDNYLDTLEGKMLPFPHCINNTDGWEIIDELKEFSKNYQHVQKCTFGYDKWKEYFDKINVSEDISSGEIVIELIGVCTDICVIANAIILRALYPNAHINVDMSCCAATTKEKQIAAANILESQQIICINDN